MSSDLSSGQLPAVGVEKAPALPISAQTLWIVGALLFSMGLLALLQTMMNYEDSNGWALLLLIPAIGAFSHTWRVFQEDEQVWTRVSRSALCGGLALLFLAVIFFFNFDWGRAWPVFALLLGLTAILDPR